MDDLHKRTQAISVMTQRDRDRVMKCLDRKDELAKAIIDQDLVLIGLIEQAKSEIIREIGTVSRAKRAMRGYGTSAIGS
jgi:Mg/Co/Ni transporter MgtE